MKNLLKTLRRLATLAAALVAVYLTVAGYLKVTFAGWEQILYAALCLVVVLPAWHAVWHTLGQARDTAQQ